METKSALVSLVFTFIDALSDGDKTFGPRSSSTAIRKMIFYGAHTWENRTRELMNSAQ